MKAAARPGLTVMEVLIAGALAVGIVAMAIQQVTEYFRLQQVLVSRTQLRHSLKVAADLMAARLRYATTIILLEEGGMAIIPIDADEDGALTEKDKMDVLYHYVAKDPLNPERQGMFERSVQVPAFALPSDPKQVVQFFEGAMGQGRRLAPQLTSVEISSADTHMYNIRLTAEQKVARQPEPVTLTLSQAVAVRSRPFEDDLPSFEEVLADWRYRQ